MELSYSFHLGNDKNKTVKARQQAKNTTSGTLHGPVTQSIQQSSLTVSL